MLPELGHVALILAFLLACAQATLPLIGAARGDRRLMAVAPSAAAGQLVFVAFAYLVLTAAFLGRDFSVLYVANHSNSLLPWYYRISAVWGAHEGSLLLWALMLAGWQAAVALGSRSLPDGFRARLLAVLGMVAAGFLAFTLFTSNPFERHLPPPPDGRDLNPLLQDFGLIIHPPMLYMGYVGFSVAFAFAIATLLDRRADLAWVRWSRPWTLAAWSFLTIGIALGSWWAYYELGWGGWWFWDPVENASFMPWLVGTALIHSQIVTERRGAFRNWTLLLAIAAFSLSLLGTFLVRSGVLTSVHAFASDPGRGLFLLIFLGIVVGGSLALYGLRAHHVPTGGGFAALSRESLLLANNLLFTASAAMVLIGTLYPLAYEALGRGSISVGPPYFAALFVPLMTPVVILLAIGPLVRWRRQDGRELLTRLHPAWPALILALVTAVFLVGAFGWPLRAAIGFLACAWVMIGIGIELRRRWRERPPGARLDRSAAGMLLAHAGVGLFVLGVFGTESMSLERDLRLAPGESATLGDWRFQFHGVGHRRGPNFEADRGHLSVFRGERRVAELFPEKRAYASGGQVMTEAAIRPGLWRDLYVSLGEPLGEGAWSVRIHVKPLVRFIWLGAALMAVGGFLAASALRQRARVPGTVPAGAAEATA
ncbi:MAG: c-type cytochrome biogenesis protein CcmF [Lysobacterales bacterium]|nr:MAG: c-type cytochrome biogenesis protein CcmF [Xanthomonadales bacterium]